MALGVFCKRFNEFLAMPKLKARKSIRNDVRRHFPKIPPDLGQRKT
jgi:hypothetical protein